MTLKGGRGGFIFPAEEKISAHKKSYLEEAEKRINTFERLEREGEISKSAAEIVYFYRGLNGLDIYKDKNLNKRIMDLIKRYRRIIDKCNLRGPY